MGKKKILLTSIAVLICLITPGLAYSQIRTVTGTVSDSRGETVTGASVAVKGTSRGIATDINGKFSMEASPNDVLVVSFIGYITKEIRVGNSSSFEITLKEDQQMLDEVVVVGYGSQKKVTLTGAVSAISSKDIITTKNENIMNTITGKVPGVRVVQRSSEPGNFDNKFDIRGLGNPLVVVDGVPRDNFTRIDPNEVESMSFLKDASAAIYGVRAANGVVLITTKKGSAQEGKFNVTYTANFGFQQPIGFPESTDAIEYMTLKNEASKRPFGNNYITLSPLPFGEAEFEAYRSGERISSDWRGASVNEGLTDQQQHAFSLNGASKNINYFMNVGYMFQDGITKTGYPDYNKWNFRANVDAQVSKYFKTEFKVSGIMDEKNDINGGTWQMIKSMWTARPTDQMYANNNPLYPIYPTREIQNPLMAMYPEKSGYNKRNERWIQSSLALTYNFPWVEGLYAKGMYSYDYRDNDSKQYVKPYYLYRYNAGNDTYNEYLINSPSKVSRNFGQTKASLMQLSLNYDRQFNAAHNVQGLLVYEESSNIGDNFNAQRQLSLDVDQLFAGNDLNQIGSMDRNGLYDLERKSFIGRINYDFRSKYILEASFRYDGSSKFSPEDQWGFFPAFSLGWRISEESFIKNTDKLALITNLKLRGSYGEMGDDGSLDYQFLTGYDYPSGGTVFNGAFINGLGFRGLANPFLTWYKAKTYDVGVDLELWNGLLSFQYDFFVRNRDGLFADRVLSLPGTFGAKLPQENLNSDRNLGYEIVLTHRNKINDVNYYVSGNFSLTRVKNIYTERAESGNSYENWKNNPNNRYSNIWWGLTYGGQFTSYEEIYKQNIDRGGGNQSTVPGDYYYKDLNGDGSINAWDEIPIATKGLPYINYGISLGGDYKGIDLNLLLQGTGMSYTRYYEALSEPLPWGDNTLTYFMDRWHPTDPNANIFDPNTQWNSGKFPATGNGSAWGDGTKAVKSAAYLRLKSVELGYTLPQKITNLVGLGPARFYVNGYNLLTFTSLKYIDPEHPGGGSTIDNKPENDLYGYLYPLTRSFNVGFSLTF